MKWQPNWITAIFNLEDLQNEGILNSTNMYVPDNFLLEKNEASFLYNKYDICPLAMGTLFFHCIMQK